MSLTKISTISLKDVFVHEIENRIISGEFKVGMKLPSERELSETMGVSLTIVKQGLAEIEGKGFLEIIPRQGIFVADFAARGSVETLVSIMRYNGGNLPEHEVRSFCETRYVLDLLAFDQTIERASDEQIKGLGRLVKSIERAKSHTEICEKIIAFYHQIYILSDNTLLPLFYYSTKEPQMEMYLRFLNKNGEEIVFEIMHRLYESLFERDKEQAHFLIGITKSLSLEGATSII